MKLGPNDFFWSGALLLMTAVVGLAFWGWSAIRRGDLRSHRRAMNGAVGLVLFFFVAYLLKVLFLGREDLSTWSPSDLWILRIHETLVAIMVLTGGAARFIARRFRGDDVARFELARRGRHRRFGRIAIVAGLAALATALLILLGMVGRAG